MTAVKIIEEIKRLPKAEQKPMIENPQKRERGRLVREFPVLQHAGGPPALHSRKFV